MIMFMKYLSLVFLLAICCAEACAESGPIRVLFLGHESEKHNSNAYYPMLAKSLGPEAIYFDYVTTPPGGL